MKKCLFVIASIAIILSSCKSVPVKESVNVYEVPGTKEEIYDKSLIWFAQTYNSAKAVLEIQDRTNGKIVGNGITTMSWMMISYPMHYTIIIDIKDNKIRTTFNNQKIYSKSGLDITGDFGQNDIDNITLRTSENLIEYLKKPLNTNW